MYFQVNSWLIIDCGYDDDGTPISDECSVPFTKKDWTRACRTFGVPSQSRLLQAAEDDENNSSDDDGGDVEDQEDIEASDDSDEDEETEPEVVQRAEGVASEGVIDDKLVRNTTVIIYEFDDLFLLHC